MIKFEKIVSILSLLFAFTACAKEEVESVVTVENPMLFGIEEIAQTKVAYNEQTDGKISATFKEDEELGLYAFYNNFYYYYTEYAAFAESVIFANQGLTVDESTTSTTYSPIKSWTFSTLYGTAPHTLDAIAYYPFREGYNPTYVQIVHTYPDNDGVGGGAATLEYYYVDEGDDDDIVNADVDFMTAHKRYTGYADAEEFREEMLDLTSIPLKFTRQTASLNLKVTKPDDYATTIIVTGITVYFDAYKKFTQSVDADSKIVWSDMTSGYALTASLVLPIPATSKSAS